MRPISGIYQISNSVHSDLIGSIFSKFLWMAEIAVVSLCGGRTTQKYFSAICILSGQYREKWIVHQIKIEIKNLLELNLVGSNLFKMP